MDDQPDQPDLIADPADRSLVEDIRRLAGDAQTTARAELAYQQSRAKLIASSVGGIVGRAALALALLFFALMGLVLGAILALTPALTAWGATAVVFAILLICAGALALWARSKWRRLVGLVTGKERGG
jgi:hypothetical protein